MIDTKNDVIRFKGGQERLKYLELDAVNSLIGNTPIPINVEESFSKIINKHSGVFANPNQALPFNTKISGTIRTKDQEPVYSKYQSYPISMI